MEAQSKSELEERRKLIDECLELGNELESLESEWLEKKEKNFKRHDRLLVDQFASLEAVGQQFDENSNGQRVIGMKECRVVLGNFEDVLRELEKEWLAKEKNSKQNDRLLDNQFAESLRGEQFEEDRTGVVLGNDIEDGEESNEVENRTDQETNDQNQEEVASSSGEKRFQCKHPGCERKYKTKDGLGQHMNLHTGKYQCQTCQKYLSSSLTLERHSLVHSNKRPYGCAWLGCRSWFKSAFALKLHKARHSDERPFHCSKDDCGKSFKTYFALRQHLGSHATIRRFHCPVDGCGMKFKTNNVLKSHVKNVHLKAQLQFIMQNASQNAFESC